MIQGHVSLRVWGFESPLRHHLTLTDDNLGLGLLINAGFEIIFMNKHKLLPGAAMVPLGKIIDPVTLMILDDYLSRVLPFRIFARDFSAIARRPESSANKMQE